ncbi:MAG: peptidase MA family metallohydrolase [Dehalococcoidales bacterium]|nr:peptidase MA family metallohydrolase [Dehalococcoidales bacterium]
MAILDSSVEAEFPFKLNFRLSARSDAPITDIRLHYTVDRESYAQVTSEASIEFMPDTTLDVQWDWDMRRTGGIPPGTGLEYWWTVQDAGGAKVESAPTRVYFDDNCYSWNSLTRDKVTIYWYEGNQAFAEELMSAAEQALEHLSEATGAYPLEPVRLYIYKSSQDLQGAMIFPQEWTGGVTFTRYGIIAIGIAPNELSWGRRTISHELTHLVVHQMTASPYGDLPVWLTEGLAMYNEGILEAGYVNLLKGAINRDSLLSVRSLSSPFSANPEESYLAYAQSYSLVEFLATTYGQGKMLELLTTFSQGNSYDAALGKVYGFNMDGLNSLWREYAAKRFGETRQTTAMPPSPVEVLRLVSRLLLDSELTAQRVGI